MTTKTPHNSPVIIILCGPPYVGKTSYRKQMYPDMPCLSTDDMIMRLAELTGKSYNEIFKDSIGHITKQFNDQLKKKIANNESFIIDRTNLTKDSRAKLLKQIPRHYYVIGVGLPNISEEQLQERMLKRESHSVPIDVVRSMQHSYQLPTIAEGFDRTVTTP